MNMAEINQEHQIKKLKRLLEGWRMALLPLKSVLLWEQQWHPCAIIFTVSLLYLFIWIMDLNTLATIALMGLILNFIDFIVPIICNSIYSPNSWTGQKEKLFEEICKGIVANYNRTLHHIKTFYAMRENSPCMYYLISISTLCTMAWMASTVNNIVLLYIISTAILLWPGIQHRGILNTLLSIVNMGPKLTSLKSE